MIVYFYDIKRESPIIGGIIRRMLSNFGRIYPALINSNKNLIRTKYNISIDFKKKGWKMLSGYVNALIFFFCLVLNVQIIPLLHLMHKLLLARKCILISIAN